MSAEPSLPPRPSPTLRVAAPVLEFPPAVELTVPEVLAIRCAREPEAVAMAVVRRSGRRTVVDRVTWKELMEGAARVAGALRESGLGPGARVLVATDEPVGLLHALLGAMGLGAIPVPMGAPSAGETAIQRWLAVAADCAPRLVLVDDPRAWQRSGLGARLDLDAIPLPRAGSSRAPEGFDLCRPGHEVALVQASAGTRAAHAVPVAHAAVVRALRGMVRRERLADEDRLVVGLPLDRPLGLGALLMGLYLGLPTFVPVGLGPAGWAEVVSQLCATVAVTDRAGVGEVEPGRRDLGSLRRLLVGGPVAPDVLDRMVGRLASEGLRPHVPQLVYALAEAPLAAGSTRRIDRLWLDAAALAEGRAVPVDPDPDTAVPALPAGAPLRGVTAEVVGDDGQVLPEGRVGTIRLRGAMLGGLSLRLGLARGRSGEVIATGDVGFLSKGRLFLVDRVPLAVGRAERRARGVAGVGEALAWVRPTDGAERLHVVAEVEPGVLRLEAVRDAVQAITGAATVHLARRGALPRGADGRIRRALAVERARHDELAPPQGLLLRLLGG